MDKRQLYDNFIAIEEEMKKMLSSFETIKSDMTGVLENNAELEIENQHLRERLSEIERQTSKDFNESSDANLSKSRQNLEKLYDQGFHVCNIEGMYGSRRVDDEPCAFCLDLIYGEREV
ncbi:DNA replication initiation control protein YabA [Dellaglioa sp. P0083]|uniref:DNA replication initiation control protein YabA n=1 Tax=Dellaglioa kimchii TaxID=3344667 RepID=UPI0038D411A5